MYEERNWWGWLGVVVVLGLIVMAVESCLEFVGLKDEEGEAFERVCKERGGRVTQRDVTCKITYAGRSYEIPIDNLKYRLDARQVRENRWECKYLAKEARQFARDEANVEGKPVRAALYRFHRDTGVCEKRRKTARVEPTEKLEPLPSEPEQAEEDCDSNYSGGCVPPYPPDVDCGDVAGPVAVTGEDVHELDGNDDGSACE